VRGVTVEPLGSANAEFGAASRDFSGAWTINVRSEQLAAVLSGFGLPDVAANGSGKFTFNPNNRAAAVSGELLADASHLERVSPELAPIGTLRLHTSFDGGLADNVARLERFQLEANTADGRKLAQIDALQRVTFSLTTQRLALANSQAEVARIALQGLPAAWAQPWAKPLTIDSGELSLALAIEAEADGSHCEKPKLVDENEQ